MVIIMIYLIENPNLRTKKNIAFLLTFFSLSIFFLGNYLHYSLETHMLLEPVLDLIISFTTSASVFLCLIFYALFLTLESGKRQQYYLMSLLLMIIIVFGGIGVLMIILGNGITGSLFFYFIAIGGTITGSTLGLITTFKTARQNLFPIQDRILMRRRHLNYVGIGIIFIIIGSFLQLLTFDIPEILVVAAILTSVGVFLLFIAINKTREHLREVSLRIIEHQLDDLREVDQLKTQIIDVSSHEMRTPISVIKGHFEFLARDENLTPENRKKSFNAIKRNIERIERSLTNMYDFSTLRRELFDFHFEKANLISVLDNTINDMRGLIEQRGLAISFNVENIHEPSIIMMDPVRISQVVRNLLENAIKYSSEGEITVRLQQTVNKYVVTVTDQGVGIERENLKSIFDPFKDQNKSTIDVRGLGLGLYISRNIIEGHNGKIWATSEGKGSQFYFSLPKIVI
jgi:signal transduction histidine kinase